MNRNLLFAAPPRRSSLAPRRNSRLGLSFGLLLSIATLSGNAVAADWSSYRNGPARQGSTAEMVTGELRPAWTYRTPAPPQMAWSTAEGRVIESLLIGGRVKYDDSLHPIVAGERMFVGSSVDHHLHCMDLNNGREVWSFATGGPIRLAPTVDSGRVYFGSDDGYAYCVAAEDGKLIWKLRAGPAEEWLLARGEMISLWPVRTGVLVDDGVAFFGGGIFPHEDIYLLAVNAADGALIWRQDNVSVQDAGRNDLSPQGNLLADDDTLYVPSGRSLPAAFDRKTGEFLFKRTFSWRTAAGGEVGGVNAMLADDQLYTSGSHHWIALDNKTGDIGFGWFDGRQLIVRGDAAFAATGTEVACYDRLTYAVNSRARHELELQLNVLTRGRPTEEEEKAKIAEQIATVKAELERLAPIGVRWKMATPDDASLLATGNLVFVGGDDRVTAYDSEDGRQVWQAAVDGRAGSLAFAQGCLLVSTDSGAIQCFTTRPSSTPTISDESQVAKSDSPFAEDEWTPIYAEAAEQILRESGVRRGFCLVVGNEQGRLAWELAKRSDLKIYAIDADAQKVEQARKTLQGTGLYGHRIVVHQADPQDTFYSNYFANLIVSDTLLATGELPAGAEAVARHLKPLGGVMLLGAPSTAPAKVQEAVARAETTDRWVAGSEIADQVTTASTPNWTRLTRGGLPGAGDWTHQYGNPANTAVSSDTRIKGGLGVLWYGDPGPDMMVNRHEGAVGPLAIQGRLVIQGDKSILAYDAYNGLFLWKHENPAAIRTGVFNNQNPANVAASETHVFYFSGDQCVQLDLATGETTRIHRLPKQLDDGKYQWGYLAVKDGVLFGAATVRTELEERKRRRGKQTEDATDYLFAIDATTGEHLWQYQGQNISHHTIAVGPKEVFFIDSSISSERRDEILRQDKTALAQLTGEERDLAEERLKTADVRQTIALNSRTGEKLWAQGVDVTDCSDIGIGGGKLTLIYQDGVLLLCGANANGHYWKQFIEGEFDRRRMVALQSSDGYKLWSRDANYMNRPIILGNQVLAEPWIYDLHSGAQKTRKHPVTGEEGPWSLMRTGHMCGMFTGAESGMLMFRSGDTAFFDMETESGTRHFAGHRLGCWINAIPAGGLVMIPEASAGCVCLFSISSTIVMEPRPPRREWSIHSAVGSLLPVKQLNVNLGAPGDRRDSAGNLWFAYPRPAPYKKTSIEIEMNLTPSFTDETDDYWNVSDAETPKLTSVAPWLYTSGTGSLNRLIVPLRGTDDGPADYEVQLHFRYEEGQTAATAVESLAKFGVKTWDAAIAHPQNSDGQTASRELVLTAKVHVPGDLDIDLVRGEQPPRLCAISIRQLAE